MKKIISLCFNIVFILSISAQEKLSLAHAIQKGIQNNHEIEIANQQMQIANNNNVWSATGRPPKLDLNINSNNGYANAQSAGFILEQSALNFGINPSLDATWILYDGGKSKITKRQLEKNVQRENVNISRVRENTLHAVTTAYYQVQIEQGKLTTFNEVLTLSRDRVNFEGIKQDFGQAGKFDLLQAQDAYFNDSTNYLVQENNLAAAFRSLNLAMGEDNLKKQYELTDEFDYNTKTYQLADLETALFAKNHQLQDLMVAKELANINTQMQSVTRHPTINLESGLSYNLTQTNGSQLIAFGGEPPSKTDNSGTNKNFDYYLNLRANFNIFDGGQKRRNLENAKVEAMIAQLNINQLKRNLSNQLQNVLADYNSQLRLVEITENRIQNAQENLNIAQERFKGGQINSFDFRSVQLAYVNAKQAQLDAIFNLKNTETELLQLTGKL